MNPPTITRAALLALPRAPDGLTYVSIGAYCWGRSPDAVKALASARENGGAGLFTMHLVNAECEIDQVSGALYYNSQIPGIRLSFAVVRMR